MEQMVIFIWEFNTKKINTIYIREIKNKHYLFI